jgi:hypothetical protein
MVVQQKIQWMPSALSSVLVLVILACSSPAKILETGRYDDVIDLSVRRLAGKAQKKEALVAVLEAAFAKATQLDMDRAAELKESGRPEDWERVYAIYRNVERRQDKIAPLLPLVDESGKKAVFRFVQLNDLQKEAREEAAAALYNDALRLVEIARRSSDKEAARRALGQLERISQYYRSYRDCDILLAEARDLGTTYVLVAMENRAPVVLPLGLEADILQLGFGNQRDKWRVFHTIPEDGRVYDYQVAYILIDVENSPEVVRERQYEESKEVQDGFVYVLDERGNVRKDTAGNDIKTPKMVQVKAFVVEQIQYKLVRLSGRLVLSDLRNNTIIETQDLGAESVFEHYASTFRGDPRALSEDSKRRIGNRPIPFPSDEYLIYEAAKRLKPLIRAKLEQTALLE